MKYTTCMRKRKPLSLKNELFAYMHVQFKESKMKLLATLLFFSVVGKIFDLHLVKIVAAEQMMELLFRLRLFSLNSNALVFVKSF